MLNDFLLQRHSRHVGANEDEATATRQLLSQLIGGLSLILLGYTVPTVFFFFAYFALSVIFYLEL